MFVYLVFILTEKTDEVMSPERKAYYGYGGDTEYSNKTVSINTRQERFYCVLTTHVPLSMGYSERQGYDLISELQQNHQEQNLDEIFNKWDTYLLAEFKQVSLTKKESP